MLAVRQPNVVRPLVMAAMTAAFVLSMTMVVVAQASAAAVTESTSTVTKKHTRGDAAGEQREMSGHLQKLTKRLKLTDDQAAKVKAIMQTQWTASSELRAKAKGQPVTPESKAALAKGREDLHADAEVKLAQVLSADQMTEYKKMRAENMKHKDSEKEEKGEKNEKNEAGEGK